MYSTLIDNVFNKKVFIAATKVDQSQSAFHVFVTPKINLTNLFPPHQFFASRLFLINLRQVKITQN